MIIGTVELGRASAEQPKNVGCWLRPRLTQLLVSSGMAGMSGSTPSESVSCLKRSIGRGRGQPGDQRQVRIGVSS